MAHPERRDLCRSPVTEYRLAPTLQRYERSFVALSAANEQRSDQLKQSFRMHGLFDEIGPVRQLPGCGGDASGCDHDTDILSIIPHSAGQLEAVDAPERQFPRP
jgi:hypothetical protein